MTASGRKVRRLAPALSMAAFVAWQPTLVLGILRSPRALATIAVAAVGVIVLGRMAGRHLGVAAGRVVRVVLVSAVVAVLLVPALRQTELDEPLPAPAQLTAGSLRGIGHDATGDVSVHRLADGSFVVRFEGADIRGAPDPVLYLVPRADSSTREGGTNLGPLRATKGSFNQAVTADFDFDRPFSVFIWCERFATAIATSDQRAAAR